MPNYTNLSDGVHSFTIWLGTRTFYIMCNSGNARMEKSCRSLLRCPRIKEQPDAARAFALYTVGS
jgi:hypothetical protein